MRQIIISHRGLSGSEPENTLKAFQATVDRGIKAIEFDVRQTCDGVIVVRHDPDITDLSISDSNYSELLAKAPDLCTLAQVLDSIPPSCLVDVEIKTIGVEENVLCMLEQKRDLNDFIITSFNDQTIARIKAINPRVRAGLLLGNDRPKKLIRTRLSEIFPTRRLRLCNADFVAPYWKLLKLAFLWRMARRKYPVYVWTVNDEKLMKILLKHNCVTGLITDRPIDAMQIMKKR